LDKTTYPVAEASAKEASLADPRMVSQCVPTLAVNSHKPVDGLLRQRRLMSVTLTSLSFQDAEFRYTTIGARDRIGALLNCSGWKEGEDPVRVRVKGQSGLGSIELNPGDWLVLRPASSALFSLTQRGHILLVELAQSLWRGGEWELVGGVVNSHALASDKLFFNTALGLFNAALATLASTPDAATALMATLRLSAPFQESYQLREATSPLVERADNKIQSQFRDADFDARRLAQQLGVSRRQLDKVYCSTGTTVSDAIWEKRLCEAALDLGYSSGDAFSVGEIAQRNGFMSDSHFARRFKSRFGFTATAYRAIHRLPRQVRYLPLPLTGS
jgi:AraC-like DNA-binding protein